MVMERVCASQASPTSVPPLSTYVHYDRLCLLERKPYLEDGVDEPTISGSRRANAKLAQLYHDTSRPNPTKIVNEHATSN